MLKGYCVSPGISIGNAIIRKEFNYKITEVYVDDLELAVKVFDNVVKELKNRRNIV